ncbi:MAG: sugar ABC transporter permease [Clostridia bacterium]|nr:sugar ABC transporter permease [Clostridia bacterium]
MEKEKLVGATDMGEEILLDDGSAPNGGYKAPKVLTRKVKRNIFFYSTIAIFIINVLVWYVYVNLSNFALAFQEFFIVNNTDIGSKFAGLQNFKYVLSLFEVPENRYMITTSFMMYGYHIFVGSILALLLSYYIYKKLFLGQFFRVILFMPSIISGVVMVTLYKYMVNNMYMELFNAEAGLLKGDVETATVVCIVYNLWMGYGSDVLLYTGAMSGINDSTVEAAALDGCTTMQEFIYITLPMIFPTLITFIVVGISNIFTNQMNLYTFFGTSSRVVSVGYFMYVRNLTSPGLVADRMAQLNSGKMCYPELAAMGLMVTAVTLPVVVTIRWLLNKYGPSAD